MYWYGHIAIDPSHITKIRRKPTKGFGRFAEILTGGLLSQKEELETFTALSILQQLNSVLLSLGITDLVRFSKDSTVIYEDKDSENQDDMQIVMEQVSQNSQAFGDSPFDSLTLLLEHHLDDLALVIEARVVRAHAIGTFPIQIIVNGLAADFDAAGNHDSVHQKMQIAFQEQEAYNTITEHLHQQFQQFMNRLELAVRQQMHIDDLHKVIRTKIIRPRNEDKKATDVADASFDMASTHHDPVFDRYDSLSPSFYYCWQWSSMMHAHGTHVKDTTIVDEQGQTLFAVDDGGLDAGAASAFDPSIPFADSDATTLDSIKAPTAEVTSSHWLWGDGGSDNSSWLSGLGFADSGGSDSGGDSSCSSSCGSSCGGGCGGD